LDGRRRSAGDPPPQLPPLLFRIPLSRINWTTSSFLIGTFILTLTAVPLYLWYFGVDWFQLAVFAVLLAATGFSDHGVHSGQDDVLKETSGPRTYRFGKTVTYVTRSGKTLDEDTVRTRVKVGIPVQVHYVGTGDNIMVDRVILDED
jgi:hypothetical protein